MTREPLLEIYTVAITLTKILTLTKKPHGARSSSLANLL